MQFSAGQPVTPLCCGRFNPTTAAFVSGLVGFVTNIAAIICILFSMVPLRWHIAWIAGIILIGTYAVFIFGFHRRDLAMVYPYVVVQVIILFLNAADFVAYIYLSTICSDNDGLCVIFEILAVITGAITIVLLTAVYGLMTYLVYMHRIRRTQVSPTFPKPVVPNGVWGTQPYAQSQEVIFSQPPPGYSELLAANLIPQPCLEEKQPQEAATRNPVSSAGSLTLRNC